MVLALLPLLLPTISKAQETDRTCYNSVWLHRGETILPSTDLFCVVRSNDASSFDDVPIIQSEDEWSDFLVENPYLQTEQIEDSPPLLLIKKDNRIEDFLLPASFSSSSCTGTQQVVIGFSHVVSCSPVFYPFNETECLSNEFLSAQKLFEPTIVSYVKNISMETSFRSNASILPVQWNQNQCQNVIQEVTVEIAMNDTHVAEAIVKSIKYATLTASNYSSFKQTFKMNFRNVLDPPQNVQQLGYMQGQEIIAFKGNSESLPFSLPKSGECRAENGTPIKFLVNATTACTFRVTRCDEAKQAIQRMIEAFIPARLRSSADGSSTNNTNALVLVRNGTEASTNSECVLNTGYVISVLYAKQGATNNATQVIVSATCDVESEKVTLALAAETTIILRYAVHFKDVTPRKFHKFI
ncbi:unnamed protein product [Cylicocyclus nassatus]|uniref:Tectonic-1-3 domain-containing protein n=1 Tax=Cylicocyclus nassatus TaxID=53992 RepID=A0AA36M9J1_CYLNA|nr:unnamed protein product [Cylicocyclus nassatus]